MQPSTLNSQPSTTLYTARYGVPPVGKKVYVRVNQFVDGWEDLPVTYQTSAPERELDAALLPGGSGKYRLVCAGLVMQT